MIHRAEVWAAASLSAMALGGPAVAENQAHAVFSDTRLRWESFDRPGEAEDADRATVSLRVGAEATFSDWLTGLVEAEAVSTLASTRAARAVPAPNPIPDDPGFELNRLQLEAATDRALITVGRQRLVDDDERHLGASAFRQNEQTYDAARLRVGGDRWRADAAYIWRVARFDAFTAGRGHLVGDAAVVRIAAATPVGWLGAVHHDLDLARDLAVPGAKSATVGVSLDGARAVGGVWASWRFDLAEQRPKGDGAAGAYGYGRARLSLETDRIALAAGHERLEGDGAAAFQFPLGSNHGFQGDADLFVVTPPQGVRDTYAEVRGHLGDLGPGRGAVITLRRHGFDSDHGGAELGSEWDAGVSASFGATRLSIELADYRADTFAQDTRRIWLAASRRF